MSDKTESYTFRIPSDLREKLELRAAEEGRSLSNLITFLLKKAVNAKG
jgi:predicted HicB family RNase H-like nuclease